MDQALLSLRPLLATVPWPARPLLFGACRQPQRVRPNRKVLDRLATELLEKETLDHNQLAEIFQAVKKLPERPQWLSSSERPVSTQGPVAVPPKKKAPAVKKTARKKPAGRKVAPRPAALRTEATDGDRG